jgi:hypothetical protein
VAAGVVMKISRRSRCQRCGAGAEGLLMCTGSMCLGMARSRQQGRCLRSAGAHGAEHEARATLCATLNITRGGMACGSRGQGSRCPAAQSADGAARGWCHVGTCAGIAAVGAGLGALSVSADI